MEVEPDPKFTTVYKRTGLPKTCRYCGTEIWWHLTEHKWYNPGGQGLHIDTCTLWQNDYRKRRQKSQKENNSGHVRVGADRQVDRPPSLSHWVVYVLADPAGWFDTNQSSEEIGDL